MEELCWGLPASNSQLCPHQRLKSRTVETVLDQGLPVVSQWPVAKLPVSGMWYDWQALASQLSHSPGDCLTTVEI
eukprot:scaffold9764_cov36-Cyclotella_meneghiniana.AAC.2